MKKLLSIALSLASIGFVAAAAEAKTSNSTATTLAAVAPQVRVQIGGGRRNNRRFNRPVRTVTQTRLVRVGRQMFRETYQVTYLPNGRTQTRLISRTRVR